MLVATLFFYAIVDRGLVSGGQIARGTWERILANKAYLLTETQDAQERLSKGIKNLMLFRKINGKFIINVIKVIK